MLDQCVTMAKELDQKLLAFEEDVNKLLDRVQNAIASAQDAVDRAEKALNRR